MTKPNPETPAERKARHRATERRCKPRDRIVSLESCQDYTKAQERVKIWGYKSKLVCPGKPDRHLLPFVHPELRAQRLNGYNIARIHGIADMAIAHGCIAAALVTLTLPGRMHSMSCGYPNPLWDGSSPLDHRATGHLHRRIMAQAQVED